MSQSSEPKAITFDQLADLREKTERISQFLTRRLNAHVNTLAPLLDPRGVFGRYLGGKEGVPRADEAYNLLTQNYREASGSPFGLRSDLDEEALGGMEHGVAVYAWEYAHSAAGKMLTVTSPVRWILTFKSDYSVSEMRILLSGSRDRRQALIRRFVVNAISMQIVTTRNPGVVNLLEDLGYKVKAEPLPGLGKLPFVVITARIQSFRPSDDLMIAATRLSGVPAFIELIDPLEIANLHDPLRNQLESILA